jgi:SPP1 family predicted phage head-tail adaptor
MTRRVKILKPVDSHDARGSSAARYVQNGPAIWAKIEPVGAKETEPAEAFEAVVTYKIGVYHTDRITHRTRLEAMLDGRTFEIVGMTNVEERDRWLALTCREVVD